MTETMLSRAYHGLVERFTELVAPMLGGGRRRSVLFLHNSYYHFWYLARALRRRGWDALTVSLEDPNGPNANYYHGEDVNLFAADPDELKKNVTMFYEKAVRRFRLLHFAGDGIMSFFPEHWPLDDPPDLLEWRRRGRKVAYTISGCNSGTSQSAVARWSALDGGRVLCDKCPWQGQMDVCSDEKNLTWGKKVERFCDLIFAETLPALDYMAGPKVVREPVTMCLDADFWRPDLHIPAEFVIPRQPGELLVYHSFGNYEVRGVNGRNIKGTPAIFAAVERLQREGVPVRLQFCTNVKNTEVRYYQLQADVIIDQLNAGRYGATAREAMMLGRPTICYVNPHEADGQEQLPMLGEVPLVSATEETVYRVLRDLLHDPNRRAELGRRSRAYALKWHSAESCAERYEAIYDRVILPQRARAA